MAVLEDDALAVALEQRVGVPDEGGVLDRVSVECDPAIVEPCPDPLCEAWWGGDGEWDDIQAASSNRQLIAYDESVLMTRRFCDAGAVPKTRTMAWVN